MDNNTIKIYCKKWDEQEIQFVHDHLLFSRKIKMLTIAFDSLLDQILSLKTVMKCDVFLRATMRRILRFSKFKKLRTYLESLFFEQVRDFPFRIKGRPSKLYLTNVYFALHTWHDESHESNNAFTISLDETTPLLTDSDKQKIKELFMHLTTCLIDIKLYFEKHRNGISGNWKTSFLRYVTKTIIVISLLCDFPLFYPVPLLQIGLD